ncbi:MAG: 50S ribosomal protein L29 [Terracidiphilus sp.]
MELAKIRSLSDEELLHHEKTSGEQLFRLRFQVSMGQNDGVKKLRQLRKEIAQIKTVSRERELGVRGATHELVSTLPAGEEKKAAKKTAKTATAKTSAKKTTRKSATASAAKKGAGK